MIADFIRMDEWDRGRRAADLDDRPTPPLEAYQGEFDRDVSGPASPLEPARGAEKALTPISPTPFVVRDPKLIRPREWLYARHMVRGFCSATVSPGGVGKSSLLMVETLAMTTGRPLLGAAPPHPLRVWIWNGEDPAEEVERRIAAACLHYGITAEDIGERLFTDSGRDLPIQIVTEDKAGARVAAPLVEELTGALRRHCIDVLVIDPFVTSHGVSENDNRAINLVATQYREIADAAGAAVELVHHVRKGPGNDGYTVEDARGAKALIDACRSARVLNPMTEAEAMKAGLESPFGYFRVENGKANMAPRTGTGNRQGTVWRRMANISLGNETELYPSGDDVGVVETWTWPDALEGIDLTHLAAVQEKLSDGDWRESEQANQWAGHAVAEVVGLDVGNWANRTREQKAARARVKVMLRDWVASGALKREQRYVGKLGREVPLIVPGDPITAGDFRTSKGVVR